MQSQRSKESKPLDALRGASNKYRLPIGRHTRVGQPINDIKQITLRRAIQLLRTITKAFPYRQPPYGQTCNGHVWNLLWAFKTGYIWKYPQIVPTTRNTIYNLRSYLRGGRRPLGDQIKFLSAAKAPNGNQGWYLVRRGKVVRGWNRGRLRPVKLQSGDHVRTASSFRDDLAHSQMAIIEQNRLYLVGDYYWKGGQFIEGRSSSKTRTLNLKSRYVYRVYRLF